MKWTAILLAGQRPGVDPLAAHFGETWKARVAIAGEPMLGHVVRTLREAPEIGRILILAQQPEQLVSGELDWIQRIPEVSLVPSERGIADSIRAVAESPDAPFPFLLTTADHPLLTAAMIAEFLTGSGDADLAIGAVERRTLLAAYPGNRRTWLRFLGGAWSGANLFALRTPRVLPALAFWSRAEKDRKHAFRLFWHFGPWLMLRAISRTIRFDQAIATAGRRLGLVARLVALSQPEAAIDVDKPSDHVLAETILRKRIVDHASSPRT